MRSGGENPVHVEEHEWDSLPGKPKVENGKST